MACLDYLFTGQTLNAMLSCTFKIQMLLNRRLYVLDAALHHVRLASLALDFNLTIALALVLLAVVKGEHSLTLIVTALKFDLVQLFDQDPGCFPHLAQLGTTVGTSVAILAFLPFLDAKLAEQSITTAASEWLLDNILADHALKVVVKLSDGLLLVNVALLVLHSAYLLKSLF